MPKGNQRSTKRLAPKDAVLQASFSAAAVRLPPVTRSLRQMRRGPLVEKIELPEALTLFKSRYGSIKATNHQLALADRVPRAKPIKKGSWRSYQKQEREKGRVALALRIIKAKFGEYGNSEPIENTSHLASRMNLPYQYVYLVIKRYLSRGCKVQSRREMQSYEYQKERKIRGALQE